MVTIIVKMFTFLVVQPEGLSELLLHGFSIFLNQEPSGQSHELLELKLPGACER
jgi:hypothetical protein